jgi:hypothetical protein
MDVSMTIAGLTPLNAQAAMWLALALGDEGEDNPDNFAEEIICAFDYLLSALIENEQWAYVFEHKDIEGLKGRLRVTLGLIEDHELPPAPV